MMAKMTEELGEAEQRPSHRVPQRLEQLEFFLSGGNSLSYRRYDLSFWKITVANVKDGGGIEAIRLNRSLLRK